MIRAMTTASSDAWQRTSRGIDAAGQALRKATNEEDFQTVGLLCREVLVSCAQAVFDPEQHPTEDHVSASKADAKRMLTAFIMKELPGGSNEQARKHAKAAVDLTVALQHDRTADYRSAALCLEATLSAVNIISIVSGRSAAERSLPSDHEPFRIPNLGDAALEDVIAHYKAQGEEPVLPLMEERDVRAAKGYSVAYYPGTYREVWVGFTGSRYEHLLMIKPIK
jgi:hypothetical protein